MHGLRSAVYATRFILSLSLGGASSKKIVSCPHKYEKTSDN